MIISFSWIPVTAKFLIYVEKNIVIAVYSANYFKCNYYCIVAFLHFSHILFVGSVLLWHAYDSLFNH